MSHELTLASIRAHVRTYFDVDSDDMPDSLLDRWTSEGWGKIVRFRRNWPGFQAEGQITTVSGAAVYAPPLKDITTIDGPDRQLAGMADDEARRRFIRNGVQDPADKPRAWSIWAGKLRLWPTPNGAYTLLISGFRAAVNPLERPPTEAIDLPHPDAAEMLLNWVMYRAAEREAEVEQAADYRDSFSQGMQLLSKDETDAPSFSPIVLNGRPAQSLGLSFDLPSRLRYQDGWEG